MFGAWGLAGMLLAVYDNSPYRALADLGAPVQPWQLPKTPRGYWTGAAGRDHARAATRWLLEHLGVSDAPPATIGATLTGAAFRAHGLGGMLQTVYHNSAYLALADVRSDALPWGPGQRVPRGYWQSAAGRAQARRATRGLLEECGRATVETDWTDPAQVADLARRVPAAWFFRHGLRTMLEQVYAGDPQQAVRDLAEPRV